MRIIMIIVFSTRLIFPLASLPRRNIIFRQYHESACFKSAVIISISG
ncbi:hypothetical protein ENKO_529 [Klebsiella phage fENko-Kae01]|nr:hypothetical protein 7t3_0144 [Salmonella phage 7t3]